MAYYGEDEWEHPRRPSARHQYSGGYYLDPNQPYRRDPQGSLNRTRSHGHAPQPIVNVYNDVVQESNQRASSRSPPFVPGASPAPYPPSPESRGRGLVDRLGEELLADDLAELRLERRLRSRSRGDYHHERSRSRGHDRSRSRGQSDVSAITDYGRSNFYKYEMDRLEREKRELEQRDQWKRETSRIEAEIEIKRLKDEARKNHDDNEREAERKKVIADYERKQREAADKAKAEEIRIKEKVEREKREAADKEKAEELRIKEKLEREAREAKEKEKREWQEFERRQKEKKEKEDKEKKEEQHRIDEAMRERLIATGFSGQEIEAIMDKEKAKKSSTTTTTTTTLRSSALEPFRGHQPVYAKIHTDHLSIETLRYYGIPFEYDHSDPNYLIILREMDKHDTNILFNHTKALRARRLLLETPKRDKLEYAFYRKRDRSKSRNRGDGEWKKFGILEYKR